jgi:hypothetical protein
METVFAIFEAVKNGQSKGVGENGSSNRKIQAVLTKIGLLFIRIIRFRRIYVFVYTSLAPM